MLRNGSAQFNIFYGCHSKELYHYLRQTLENTGFGNVVIHVGTNNINNRGSSKSLQLLQNLQKIAAKCSSYGTEDVFISSAVYNKTSNGYFVERINAKIANICK